MAVGDWTRGGVTVHDLTTGAELGSYVAGGGEFILNLAMSSDGRRLALSTSGGELIVIDVAALGRVECPADAVDWTVNAHNGSVQFVSVSDGGFIATGSSAGNVRVWSATGELVADLPIEPITRPPSSSRHFRDEPCPTFGG